MHHKQPRMRADKLTRTKPTTFPLENKLRDICREHGGLVMMNDYSIVDNRKYEVRER